MQLLGRRTLSDRSRGRGARLAAVVVLALLIGVGVNHVVWAVAGWPLGDLSVYLAAAERLRTGEALYLVTDPYNTYWYAPWFAVAMVPLTFLPLPVASVLWSAVLVACSVAVGWVLWQMGTPASRMLAVLTVPALFAVSAGGNVQAPLVLALLIGLHRRSGPVWVALAASLKFTPVLFGLVYLAHREWVKAAWAAGLSGILLAPAFLLGLPLDRVEDWAGAAPSILAWGLPVYVAAVGACCLAALAVPRYAALSVAAGAVLALPRLFVYDVTLVAAAAAPEGDGRR
jgi:alpha-1,2-mannosyltransferase